MPLLPSLAFLKGEGEGLQGRQETLENSQGSKLSAGKVCQRFLPPTPHLQHPWELLVLSVPSRCAAGWSPAPWQLLATGWKKVLAASPAASPGRNLLLVSKLGCSFQMQLGLVPLQELQRDACVCRESPGSASEPGTGASPGDPKLPGQ